MTLNKFKEHTKFNNVQLAKVFGVSRQSIHKWLNDESRLPLLVKVFLFARGQK